MLHFILGKKHALQLFDQSLTKILQPNTMNGKNNPEDLESHVSKSSSSSSVHLKYVPIQSVDIPRKISISRAALGKLGFILKSRNIPINLKGKYTTRAFYDSSLLALTRYRMKNGMFYTGNQKKNEISRCDHHHQSAHKFGHC